MLHMFHPDVCIQHHEQLTGPVKSHCQLQKARMLLKGDCWLESQNQGTWHCLRTALENNPLISCLLKETPVQNIPHMPSVVGAGGVCDIQPREELLSNCVLPSGCLQLPVMFCFDDGNSSILCSQGSLCVSRWVYVVCIDFSIELVWSYQLRCQTHLLLQSEFIFVN